MAGSAWSNSDEANSLLASTEHSVRCVNGNPIEGVQVDVLLPKPDGFGMALHYLQRVPGVLGGIVVVGDRIGVSGRVEIAG